MPKISREKKGKGKQSPEERKAAAEKRFDDMEKAAKHDPLTGVLTKDEFVAAIKEINSKMGDCAEQMFDRITKADKDKITKGEYVKFASEPRQRGGKKGGDRRRRQGYLIPRRSTRCEHPGTDPSPRGLFPIRDDPPAASGHPRLTQSATSRPASAQTPPSPDLRAFLGTCRRRQLIPPDRANHLILLVARSPSIPH